LQAEGNENERLVTAIKDNKRIIEDTESYMSSQNFHSSRAEIR
jgi:hypothetical protein